MGVLIALVLIVNLMSGWYGKADAVVRQHSSVVIVILIAVVAIVVFFVIFSARHQWDQNELRYRELLAREGVDEGAATLP